MKNDKQKERLVELIQAVKEDSTITCPRYSTECSIDVCKGCQYDKEDGSCDYAAREADYLLANGVFVPPCKAGDKVYEVLPKCGYIRSLDVVGFHLGKFPDLRGHKRKEYLVCYSDYSLTHVDLDKFGKTVFLTKEEAEAKLKEGVQG